jgi:hypothetical protein
MPESGEASEVAIVREGLEVLANVYWREFTGAFGRPAFGKFMARA